MHEIKGRGQSPNPIWCHGIQIHVAGSLSNSHSRIICTPPRNRAPCMHVRGNENTNNTKIAASRLRNVLESRPRKTGVHALDRSGVCNAGIASVCRHTLTFWQGFKVSIQFSRTQIVARPMSHRQCGAQRTGNTQARQP